MNTVTCGVATTIQIIGRKWAFLILHNLMDGKKRFGELQRSLTGISPKTLSIRLSEFEKDGIITKKIFPEVPLRVEYSLTAKGKSLGDIITKMREWGEQTQSSR